MGSIMYVEVYWGLNEKIHVKHLVHIWHILKKLVIVILVNVAFTYIYVSLKKF